MNLRAIYYDTETTGVKPDKDRIIELAAFDPMRKQTFVQLINPGIPIPPDSSAIHNITDSMVADAPSFKEIAPDFASFCQGDVVLIAHNNDGFDLPFMKQEFSRNDHPFPPCLSLDSLKWARKYRPDLPRHTLQHLREVYGIKANTAHRALDDVLILYQVFSAMIDDLSMETVLALLQAPVNVQVMPFGKYQGSPLEMVPKDYVKWLKNSGALDKEENKSLRQALDRLFAEEKVLL